MKKLILITLVVLSLVLTILTPVSAENTLTITPVCYTEGRGYKVRLNGDFDGIMMGAALIGVPYWKHFTFTGDETKIRLAYPGDYALYNESITGSAPMAYFQVPYDLPDCEE